MQVSGGSGPNVRPSTAKLTFPSPHSDLLDGKAKTYILIQWMNCIFFTCSCDFKNYIFFKGWVTALSCLDNRPLACKLVTNPI